MTSTSDSSQPLVSVIIASYNHAPYIQASIESVLQQSYPNIELLVVDDGSRDDSVARIEALQKVHGFDFRVQANKGLSRTLNETIERARGRLIAPFGSDDIMLPQRIATQVAYMADKPEVGICAGAIQTIDADGRPGAKPRALPLRRLDFEDVFMDRKPGAPAPTLLFRREALERVGGFEPEVRLEDLMIELKITHAGYFIDILGEPLALYRVHDSNTYKNYRFMVDNVLKTYARFSDHPAYPEVCARFRNSMLLKCARSDRALAWALLREIPPRFWRWKTLRGLARMLPPTH
ncbi:glycosyltransferase family 2 protein [Pseudomonas sp. GD03721]|uniref:glycosyltransferase family 2 protein n=1 Tax=Ectopseudomonas oleovorans TaxID=301 RepID=UPI000CF09E56|nr:MULTISPECIES: glycosyltransferase family A protein [Pseudomonas]MDH1442989.1 glycosyltransferase family 2 protein [Pseudomonas sp. GD03722]PPV34389.1 glycosyl transferase [Pseudomonas oleovorans]WGG01164.1 glycosyltransferase family 2 protein [Pseudomonas sp. GD03721]WGG05332.1 glycosyltransferase family 2 protein [Pseudomonas sp. GD03919]